MPCHPVRVLRSNYRGNDQRLLREAKRHNTIAQQCEEYLNQKVAKQHGAVHIYLYRALANDLGLDIDKVREIMIAVDGGHNGITIRKTAETALPPV